MKRFLTVVLMIALAASSAALTSCKSSKPKADPDTKEVVVWNRVFEEWSQKYSQDMVTKYNSENRGYTAKQEFIPIDAWEEKMKAAQQAGNAPDTYITAYNAIISAAKSGTLLPLDNLLPQSSFDDLYDNVKSMVSYNGKYYAYPQLLEPSTILYYRKDLLAQAGYTEPPKTWAQLIEYGKKLTTDKVYGLGFAGFGVDMGWASWGWQYQAAGHLAINSDWSAPTINDQGYKDLAGFIKDLYTAKIVPVQPLSAYNDIIPFGQGFLAMDFCGSWGIATLEIDYPDMIDKVGIAPAPTKDGSQDKVTATNGGWAYAVDARTDIASGAADYIEWLIAGDAGNAAKFFETSRYSKASPRKSVDTIINSQSGAKSSPWLKTISEVAQKSMPEPIYPFEISNDINLMFEAYTTNEVGLEEAVSATEEAIRQCISNNKLAGTNPVK